MYGIGVDIVKKDRISFLMERYGNRFLEKVFSPDEIDYCMNKKERAECFAGKFAAKEAFIKAKGGVEGLILRKVEILNDVRGRPYFRIYGKEYPSKLKSKITYIKNIYSLKTKAHLWKYKWAFAFQVRSVFLQYSFIK